jgi:hypothetical protein
MISVSAVFDEHSKPSASATPIKKDSAQQDNDPHESRHISARRTEEAYDVLSIILEAFRSS